MEGHIVLIAGHVCSTDTDMSQHCSGNWTYCGCILSNVEVLGLGLNKYSFDSLENMAYVHYHIVYDFVAVRFSDSGNSETDVDHTEVFCLCFVVKTL